MFKRLHERTRRQICRGLFLALGLLPTSVVLAWSVARSVPQHVAAAEAELSELTGTQVTIARVTHPLPYVTLYEGVELADRETAAPQIRCRTLEVTLEQSKTLVELSQVEILSETATDVWQLLARRLHSAPQADSRQMYLAAHDVTWKTNEVGVTFVDLQGRLGPTKQGTEADFKFRLAAQPTVDLATLRIERKVREGSPSTHVQFNTGGGRFPAQVLAPLKLSRDWLGSQALFDGYLSLEEHDGWWSGDVQGHLVRLDLDALVGQHFPHVLTGQADVTLRKGVIAQNRLIEADGSIVSSGGTIGRSLLAAGIEHLNMRGGAGLNPSATTTTFDQCAFTFAMSRRGWQIFGQCAHTPGAVLMSGSTILWEHATVEVQPVAQLIRALVPDSAVQVPATRESQTLIDVLPVPEVVAPRDPSKAKVPQVHVRGAKGVK